LDASGLLFAGTSTGGTCCKLPGRVGDSPLIGCGCYADAQTGGVSCTGHGEGIMKIVMAKSAIDLLRRAPDPQAAANAAVDLLHIRANTTGGLILLDASGKPAAQFNTPHMAHGYVQPDGSFFVSP
jgi:beta-aspartyl-peptidase (threonine type)